MNIQSKSNILSQFQNTRLLFTAKLDFLQNSYEMEPKMPGATQGQFFWPILWPMVSIIIGQKFWGVLLRLLRWHFSAVSTFRTVSVNNFTCVFSIIFMHKSLNRSFVYSNPNRSLKWWRLIEILFPLFKGCSSDKP